MINAESISIITLLLNSVLLTGFIIPQVQSLKEIKDRLLKHNITYVADKSMFSSNDKDNALQKNEIQSIHNLFDLYRIRSSELSSLVKVFYVSIGVAICSILIIAFGGDVGLFSGIHTILQLVLLLFAIHIYSISPDKIQQANYLVREMLINPHSLINALELELYYESGKGWFQQPKKDDPLIINLSLKLRVFGFRFLYIVTGENDKVYFASLGPINSEKQIWRHFLPKDKVFDTGEMYRIELGSFPFNAIQEKQELNITLLIFCPFFKNEKLNPMCAYQKFEVKEGHIISSLSGGVNPIDTREIYRHITYRGENNKILELIYDGDANTIMDKIIKKYQKELKQSKKLIQYSDLTGNLLQ